MSSGRSRRSSSSSSSSRGVTEGNEEGGNNESSVGRRVRGRGVSGRREEAGREARENWEGQFPPPLTTLVTHRDPSGPLPTVRRRFDFLRRNTTSEDGQQRLVIEARERALPETDYYMRTTYDS